MDCKSIVVVTWLILFDMVVSQIIGIALALFALIFVISAIWWWAFKRFEFVKTVLDYSTIVLLTLILLLLIALAVEGNLLNYEPIQNYF